MAKCLNSRPYAGENDLPSLQELLAACAPIVRYEFHLWDLPAGVEGNTQLWAEEGGRVVGIAVVFRPSWLLFVIHPQAMGSAVEAEVIAWGNEQALKFAGASDERIRLRCLAREDDAERMMMLERHGFTTDEGYTLRMARPLEQPIPAPQMPEGFAVRAFAGGPDAEDWRGLWNDTRAGRAMTRERCLAWRTTPERVPEQDSIAVALDGTFAAYCMCSINAEENAQTGHRDGWTDPIGTRQGFRRRGLARALVLTGLRGLKARGCGRALLGVASDNEPAIQLYESLGYRPLYKKVRYSRLVS
jgi:mycothiol synthase